jgi:hypothetical protein
LVDDLKALGLLKGLTIDINGDVVRVDYTHHEGEVLRNKVVMLFGNKHSSDVETDLVLAGVVVGIEIGRSTIRQVEDGSKDDFSFSVEVHPVHGGVGLPTDALVEIDVILIIDVFLLPKPDGLVGVDAFPLPHCLLDLLPRSLLSLFLHFQIIVALGRSINRGVFFHLPLVVNVDGEVNKLGVPLD